MNVKPDAGDRLIDPMFDGHLERPVETMTPRERLRYAWEGTLLLAWARRVRISNGRAVAGDFDLGPQSRVNDQ